MCGGESGWDPGDFDDKRPCGSRHAEGLSLRTFRAGGRNTDRLAQCRFACRIDSADTVAEGVACVSRGIGVCGVSDRHVVDKYAVAVDVVSLEVVFGLFASGGNIAYVVEEQRRLGLVGEDGPVLG